MHPSSTDDCQFYSVRVDQVLRCLPPPPWLQVSPWDKREEANEKKLNFALANSDHLALLQAYKVRTHAQ